MRYSKTNTTQFISRSSENSWSLSVACVRLPSAWRREVVSRIQHLGTSNFYYFPQYHVVFVNYLLLIVDSMFNMLSTADSRCRMFSDK